MADIQKLNVNGNTYDISTTWEKVTGKPNYYEFSTQRDFGSGTLIKTNINYDVVSGDPFYGEIKGNTYDNARNSCFTQFQGYIYDNTIIAYGVTHLGHLHITPITAMNIDGKLCFWFPRLGYWMGFSIKITTGYDYSINRVTSVIDSAEPSGTKKVVLTSSTVYNINSQNIASQSVNYATSAGSASNVPWSGVTGKPTTFTPSSHTHSYLPTTEVSQEQSSNDDWIKSHALSTLRGHVYNYNALEWQYLFGISSSKAYGSILRTSYGNGTPRLQVMGLYGGTWSNWREVSYDGHTHDDRYYTESEVDTKLSGKSDTGHTHSYLPLTGGTVTGLVTFTNKEISLNGLFLSYADSALRVHTQNGNSYFGMMNDSHCHIYTDGPSFYMNKPLKVDNGYDVIHSGNISSYALTSLPSHTHTKSQITDFPSSMPASDVYAWAKASTKPTYNFREIGPGIATIGDGANRLMFRTNASYASGMYYSTPGNESIVFANKNAVTSWIFANTDPTSQTAWTSLTPCMQIKNGRVVINKLIAEGTNASYNLDVNGSANATTLYENGTRVALSGHTHDDRYYTESEINTKLSSKSDTGHTHSYLPLSGGAMSSGARISASDGNLLIGNSSNAGWVGVQDMCSQASLGDGYWSIRTSGVAVFNKVSATNGFFQSSDERLKTFYDPIKVDLDKLKTLRKNYFKFNDKDKLEIGVSAQEIQSIYPEIVSTDNNGYLSVAYDKLSVIALAAIDEQQNIINEQNNKINQLEERLKAIENILSKLTS